MRKLAIGLILALGLVFISQAAYSHCEIPCGIYDDPTRVKLIAEHITTIEASMTMIQGLKSAKEPDQNQLMRWISNKDKHAQYLQEIVWQYFMTQRVKPVDVSDAKKHEKYIKQITLLHRMLIAAMKSKQTTDLKHVKELKSLLNEFQFLYLGKSHEAGSH